ncbi:NAD(P)H-dependent flavin oxidoreductase [Azospirillum picis]|uniref:Enoyl-[acyl-carrier protein] reductase II n=1 Tax=Azospirillum picis TaxID=488438 RepID=A0ABU0MJZ9_9PROT|nr:nitronate monooxygenase [Azospirillum picis]MBP2299979.1 enoyl-[acyl-carrier protein] reductase II [Azospirillum picis]MDQ0533783.1 enoyl-[acyl-carrier protein] reductase II [Azospirillum picis]
MTDAISYAAAPAPAPAPTPLAGRAARARLDRLWQRGCDFLGTPTAIMGGAMSWVSERRLVAAISDAGGFGVLACGSMGPDQLAEEIAATRALTARPFGVNLINMHPALDRLLDVCREQAVGHVVIAGGLPSGATLRRIKDGGAKALAFAPTLIAGRRLVKQGADALVIEGTEAGGHIGPVSTTVLAQEILPDLREVPVFVAGGIGRGETILSYLELGASGVQIGTRFVCATECIAHPSFKQAFIRASARDAQPSVQIDPRFPVIPVRALANEASKRFMEFQREVIAKVDAGAMGRDEGILEIEHFWAGALRRAVIDGDVESGSLMAGQSVGLVTREQPVAEILAELTAQAETALARRAGDEASLGMMADQAVGAL